MLLRQLMATKKTRQRPPPLPELVEACVAAVTAAALGNAISSPYVCAEQDKCASDSEIQDFWWKRLGWNQIILRVRVHIGHKPEFSASLSRALKPLGVVLSMHFSNTYHIQPINIGHARTVQDLDLIWELGAHTVPISYKTWDVIDCSCKVGRWDPLCGFHSHASLVHSTNTTVHNPLEWQLLRARWTPLRGAWIAACVAW
jgi:hypothetical protein